MKVVVFILISVTLTKAYERRENWEQTLDQVEERLADSRDAPIGVKMEKLKGILTGLIGDYVRYGRATEREQRIHDEALNLLLNTPGHAYHVRDQIKEIQNEIQKDGGGGYLPFRYVHPIFKQLPSAETAKVLSEFLDEIIGDPDDWDDITKSRESWRFGSWAARYLREMLEDAPDLSIYDREGWLAWREEVRSGKRTFRFKGGKVDYNFDGPIESNRVTIVRENRSDTNSSHTTPAPASSLSNKTSGTSSHNIDEVPRWIYFALTALIVAVLGWQFCARMKKS